jgi:hypothetical protein
MKAITFFLLVSFAMLIGYQEVASAGWQQSCKPQNSAMEECSGSVGASAWDCMSEVEDGAAKTCADDLKKFNPAGGTPLPCDGGINYNRAACTLLCRATRNPASGADYKTGTCSVTTGNCTCSAF